VNRGILIMAAGLGLGAVMLITPVACNAYRPPEAQKGLPARWTFASPAPRGAPRGAVPTDDIGIAQVRSGGQAIDVHVGADGYRPAVLVLQRGLRTTIRFIPDKLDACNSVVVFPGYPVKLNLTARPRDAVFPEVVGDFTFCCGMDMLHGYVKVVDDITKVDMNAVKQAVQNYKPAAGGGGCCG
jgi:uncharacterized protein